MRELSFLYVTYTCSQDMFNITVKSYDYIPKGIQVAERIRICIKISIGTGNSISIKVRALIFVRDTSSWPVLHESQVALKYSERYSSYKAGRKIFYKRAYRRTTGSSQYPSNLLVGGIKTDDIFCRYFCSEAY